MSKRNHFHVKPGKRVRLDAIDPADTGQLKDGRKTQEQLAAYLERLHDLQQRLFAERRRSVLICLQALDTGGKDGTINRVLGAMNPMGCRVTAFGPPSTEEAAHDFLWRVHRATPARGEVAIFNRSHYEDVLVPRVRKTLPRSVWSLRYGQINAFERMLAEQGTLILKFFLHISKDEQLERLRARMDDPAKQWKIQEADFEDREHWGRYRRAYEDVLSECSTTFAPWYVIPANHKWFRDLAVARIVVENLERLRLEYPPPTAQLGKIRRKYPETARAARG